MQLRFEQLETRNLLATLMGTPGDDVFAAGPGWATLNGTDYIGDYDFDGGAGQDTASLFDSPGDDVFTARPGAATLGATSVVNCEFIHGYAKAGGVDVAYLLDSAGDDTFVGEVEWGKLFGDGFFLRAKFFEKVEADASEGLDIASLDDTIADDVVIMKPGDVTLFSPLIDHTVRAFDYVHAYARDGGYDTAHLYGDYYTGLETYTRMFGDDGTVNRAKFFEEVAANRERVNAPVYEPVVGEVTTLTGTLILRRAIELGSGDTLTGDATLTRGNTAQKNVAQDALEGAVSIFVPDTTGYMLGDELTILAYNNSGAECVIVVGLGPDWIAIESPLSGTYTVANGAAVVNYFPLVRAMGTGITIEGLTLDGNRDPAVLQWQIIGGGLIRMEATNSVINEVTVVNSPSTGIFLDGGRDNAIMYSEVTNNFGHGVILEQEIDTRVEYTTLSYNGDRENGDGILINGGAGHIVAHNLARQNERYGLHPAGELTRGGTWSDNDASENVSNGFHFCYSNFDILVTGNTLHNNGRSGVGGLGVGGEYADRFNIVADNVATGNGRYGIETNGGRDNTIINNDVRGNQLGGVLIVGDHIFEGNLG